MSLPRTLLRTPRRVLPTTLLGLTLVLGVSACGSDDDASSDPTGSPSATASGASGTTGASDAASWPVTVDHEYGTSTVNEKPERILVMHGGGIDPVISLGLDPVAMLEIPGQEGNMPWLDDIVDWPADPDLVTDNIANLEAAAHYDPDLIIVADRYADEARWKELEAIAPTLAYDWPADGPAWPQILDGVAKATGTGDKAAEITADYEARVAEVKEQFPGIDTLTYNSAIFTEGQLSYTHNSVLEDLGMEQTGRQQAAGARGTVSLERLDELDGDVLIIYDASGDRKQLEANPQFKNLTSVKNGTLIWQDMALGFAVTTASGPLSFDWAIEHITPQLTAAVE
ncbi:ABC transporter substrate-binding protein [uncultured Corynebacterium sp.]|uniref:ABC transporter substrate-binding protein n=1 Tax=uncultured Corynebacterium sp. TaxID=159447 RepID=UPI0025EFFBD8|nr:ABC transporter substrate-binding protein [uncultured Corynebacterium sp.]